MWLIMMFSNSTLNTTQGRILGGGATGPHKPHKPRKPHNYRLSTRAFTFLFNKIN